MHQNHKEELPDNLQEIDFSYARLMMTGPYWTIDT